MTQVLRSTPRASRPRSKGLIRAAVIGLGFGALVAAGLDFLIRDSLRYLDWTEASYQRFWSDRVPLAAHVLTASLALIVAPIQFSDSVRKRWPTLHRRIGWTYIVCALVSAPATFFLSFRSVCPMCIPPFVVWSILFMIVTGLALLMALRRRFDAHRQFMIRSWVLLNGFVFVRLDNHIGYPLPTGTGVSRPAMLIWVAWVIPLLLTEMWLSWAPLITRKRASTTAPGKV